MRVMTSLNRRKCLSHINNGIRFNVIVLRGIAHYRSYTLMKTLGDIMPATGINGLNRC